MDRIRDRVERLNDCMDDFARLHYRLWGVKDEILIMMRKHISVKDVQEYANYITIKEDFGRRIKELGNAIEKTKRKITELEGEIYRHDIG